MLGFSREEFIEKKLWEVGAFRDTKASKEAFQSLQKNEYIRYKDLPLKAKDGKLIQVEFVSNVYLAGKEKVIQCNIRDITERHQAEDALLKSEALFREQSVRDHLTGLFNRRYMEETLERELRRAARRQLTLGIIMLDVDNFKHFNDTWGHAAGDMILHDLGSFLLQYIRGEDIASRFGGDEFIIILPDASQSVALERARLINAFSKQLHFTKEDQIMDAVSFSIGVATYPADGFSSISLMRAVDAALYRAKRNGRGQVKLAG
jgi:diguanylate cyclase (GGDEF)-like protein